MARERPRTEDYSGLQIAEQPQLEVSQTQQGLSQQNTWGQTSLLPEAVPSNNDDTYNEANPFTNNNNNNQAQHGFGSQEGGFGLNHHHHQQSQHQQSQQYSPQSPPPPPFEPGRAPGTAYSAHTNLLSSGGDSDGRHGSIPSQVSPSESTAWIAGSGLGGGGGGGGQEKKYHDNAPLPSRAGSRTICGLRRTIFWAVLTVGIFALVAAIAVGVGVGIATKNVDSSSSDVGSTTASLSSTTTSTATASGTGLPSPTATSAFTSQLLDISCPAANRTLYAIPNTSPPRKFLLMCGRDYNSNLGAVDMYTANTTTFALCLSKCAQQDGCTAVGWGIYYGVGSCFLKSSVGEPNVSSPAWYAAVEDDSG